MRRLVRPDGVLALWSSASSAQTPFAASTPINVALVITDDAGYGEISRYGAVQLSEHCFDASRRPHASSEPFVREHGRCLRIRARREDRFTCTSSS
jgi:hypothetical protein